MKQVLQIESMQYEMFVMHCGIIRQYNALQSAYTEY